MPVKLGAPSATPFDGIVAVEHRGHHVPKHAIAAVDAAMPAALANLPLPFLPDVKVLARRGALIIFLVVNR